MKARSARYFAVAASAACLCVLAQELVLRRTNDQLSVAAPRLRFITGKPLERMRNGASVTYDMQLIIFADNRQSILRRGFERFVLSYDLWEEKFSATSMRTARASASHLTVEAAEAWCLDHLTVPATGLATGRPLYLRLDVRAQEARESRANDEEEGLTLSRLIEIFSKAGSKAGDPAATQWRAEAGPILLPNGKP